jgi:polar amino acid transport system substrate-binding protein
MRPTRPLLAALLVVPAMALAACGSSSSGSSSTASTTATAGATQTADACTKAQLKTHTAGTLTVATDKPAYPPYFVDDKPANGQGFESAVAFAVAKQLGYAPADVKWVTEPFNSSYAPGPKDFDFDVNQISITPQRQKAVDFSAPYFEAPQALVALDGSKAASATSLADLKDTQLGVQIGTTSLQAVNDIIKPSTQAKVFDNSTDVVTALKQKQVDGIVVDLPTAFYLTGAELEHAKIVGQFKQPGGDQWGALLAKGSPLTPCVTKAVEQVKASGELAKINQKWLGAAAGAPELQ